MRPSRLLAFVSALLLSLCLTACVTVAPNGLSAADTANLQFTNVEVRSAPAVSIRWAAAEEDYLRTKGLAMIDIAAATTPEARSYVEDLASKRLKAALERRLTARAVGTRPARLVVTIKRVVIPSLVARVIIGGAAAFIEADIEVVDARTGTVLTRYAGDAGSTYAPGGLGALVAEPIMAAAGIVDFYDRAADAYATRFDIWLTRS